MGASTNTAGDELVITRVFDAPRALVFKVWTTPEHLARWWGPQGCTMLACEMDVRPGGSWYRHMRTADGYEFTKRGVYREVVVPERLVFTYENDAPDSSAGHEMLVTVTFTERGQQTEVTLRQTGFPTAASRDGHTIGWTSALERCAAYLKEGGETG